MKKTTLAIIIAAVVVIGVGAALLLRSPKACADLDEQACKKADNCLSVLVPCSGPTCASNAVFTQCKDK
ncbi:MAG: hypothetical protein PHY34_04815 [Patescibacteria group bacterium]|nr:hypothetical protein [Patescibacteria group bacterium]MDD5715609.1 hypothetical protein [Patescibacteria group bacterium]